MKTKSLFLLPALIAVFNLMPAGRVTAQTFTILHRFTGSDGSTPFASLILSGNTLYGTTPGGNGPRSGFSTLFAVNTDGMGFTNLHSFKASSTNSLGAYTNNDGVDLESALILSGTTLYGTALNGGSSGFGTVFAIGTDGTGFRTLHTFAGYPGDGANPEAGLILTGDTLYGTTVGGGNSERGTVFAINTDGAGYRNLHSFTAGSSGYYTNNDGAYPETGLILAGDTLYGTAFEGGSSGYGTVFAITTNGTGFTTLHSFTTTFGSDGYYGTNSDGAYPDAGLVLLGETLYGTAESGGSSGFGTVFAITTNGTGFTTLHSFTSPSGSDGYYDSGTNSDGAYPSAGLIISGNTLFGVTSEGGSSGEGTVFAVNTNGTGLTNLHSFGYEDGISPHGGLLLSGNTLYGTASDYFMDFRNGTVFSLSFRPQLRITPSGADVVLTWPTNFAGFDYTGYTLQSSTDLVSPAVWNTNSPVPVVVNGQNTVAAPISSTHRFYRLGR